MAKISIEKKSYQSRSIDETGKKLREKGTVMLHISIGFNRKKIPNYLILIAVSLNLADLQKWIKLNCFFFYFEFNSNSLPSEIETEWGGGRVEGRRDRVEQIFRKNSTPNQLKFPIFFCFIFSCRFNYIICMKGKKKFNKKSKEIEGKRGEDKTKGPKK